MSEMVESKENTVAVDSSADETRAMRWGVYVLLITLSVGTMLGRIFAVDSVDRTADAENFASGEEIRSGAPPR